MNTSSMAARMVGMHSGTITVRKRLMPLQPMLSAASSRELSMFFMAPETYRNTSGNSCSESTSRMPLKP